MTAHTDRLDAPELSAAERARLDHIESAPACVEDTERRVRLAISDPGSVTPRVAFGRGEYETVPAWAARAALIVLKPPPGTDTIGLAVQRVEPGLSAESNGRRLAWFTDAELEVELTRRAAVAGPQREPLADWERELICVRCGASGCDCR